MVIINPATQVKTHIGRIIIVKKTKRKILINRFIGTNIENIPNSSLINNSITINGTETFLGDSISLNILPNILYGLNITGSIGEDGLLLSTTQDLNANNINFNNINGNIINASAVYSSVLFGNGSSITNINLNNIDFIKIDNEPCFKTEEFKCI